MTVQTDWLQWLNLLLIPVSLGVLSIHGRIVALEATQRHHSGRLRKLDGING